MSDDRLQCETISSQCHWIHSKAQQTPNRYLFGTTELQVAPYQTIPWQFFFFFILAVQGPNLNIYQYLKESQQL